MKQREQKQKQEDRSHTSNRSTQTLKVSIPTTDDTRKPTQTQTAVARLWAELALVFAIAEAHRATNTNQTPRQCR